MIPLEGRFCELRRRLRQMRLDLITHDEADALEREVVLTENEVSWFARRMDQGGGASEGVLATAEAFLASLDARVTDLGVRTGRLCALLRP